MLDELKAKHVFLISDSCFSSNLMELTRGTPAAVRNYPAAYDRVSRHVMSSGGNDTVYDVSKFAAKLKDILIEFERPYLTPDYLYSQIMEEHKIRPLNTTKPRFAAFPLTKRHEHGGSFLFFRKNPTQPALPPPPPERQQGEQSFFVGKWITTVENNNSFDDYELTLNANGRCTVKVSNDNAQMETTGNWSFDGTIFKLNATFRNPTIAYVRNIQWTSLVSYGGGNNSFNILGRAMTNGSQIRITFFRND